MVASSWLAERNAKSLARLQRSLPSVFSVPVLNHALAQRLVPPTPRLAVECYWRHHPFRADRLARALAHLSGAPEGWTWRVDGEKAGGLPSNFRSPPAPYREAAHAKGAGNCAASAGNRCFDSDGTATYGGAAAEYQGRVACLLCCRLEALGRANCPLA